KFQILNDGDSLASEVDDYCVVCRALSDGFLYIFQIDSSGKSEWLFPRNDLSKYSAGSNPLVMGQTIQVPSAEKDGFLYLDRNPGVEHVYAVFSVTRWTELEAELAKTSASSAATPISIKEPIGLGVRGVGGIRVDANATNSNNISPIQIVSNGGTIALSGVKPPVEASDQY